MGYQKVAETEAAFEPTRLERRSLAGGGGKEAQEGNTSGVQVGTGLVEELEKAVWGRSPASTWASEVQDTALVERNLTDVQKCFLWTSPHCRYSLVKRHCCSSGHNQWSDEAV